MIRLLSALLVALLLAGVILLPEGDRMRLAALKVQEIVKEGEFEIAPSDHLPLWLERHLEAKDADRSQPVELSLREALFASPAFERTGESSARLRLSGARSVAFEEAAEDLEVHLAFREGLVRGLREAAAEEGITDFEIAGERQPLREGLNLLLVVSESELVLFVHMPNERGAEARFPWVPPTRSSILPPLVAIAFALLLRRPVPALLIGVLTAAYMLQRSAGAEVVASTWSGGLDIVRVFFKEQLLDPERQMIIVFVVAMLAMVGIVTRSGGVRGVMNAVARLAGSVRSTQFATYLMGLAVFFDDYANTILVGGTMRPLTDRFKIAREKLAYIVDSTAAPVAGISIFSTWIAFEVSTFSAQLPLAGLQPSDGYAVFLQTLPYRFYCIFSLVLVAIVTLGGRDFGPMLTAERRARTTGLLVRAGGRPMVKDLATTMEPAPGIAHRAHRAVVPLLLFIGVTLFEMLRRGGLFGEGLATLATGEGSFFARLSSFTFRADLLTLEGATQILYDGSGSAPLMVGSLVGLAAAVLLSLRAGLRGEIWDAAFRTLRSVGVALAILYLAWMLAAACDRIGTALYLTVSLQDMLYPMLLPVILVLLSGAVAFATGSSWGTMGILLPLVVGLSYQLGQQIEIAGQPAGMALMILSIGAVLEGSIFGDHCSPISDTTVLSSVASASDHVDHVRTQAPYALLCVLVAIVAGYMPCAAFGLSPYVAIPVGAAMLYLTMRLLGRRAEDDPERDRTFLGRAKRTPSAGSVDDAPALVRAAEVEAGRELYRA